LIIDNYIKESGRSVSKAWYVTPLYKTAAAIYEKLAGHYSVVKLSKATRN
jgi:hypothetical protein